MSTINVNYYVNIQHQTTLQSAHLGWHKTECME